MANCKICGKPVVAANVFHSACWENEASKVAEEFCDNYCRFPFECEQDDLDEKCDNCPIAKLLNLGV